MHDDTGSSPQLCDKTKNWIPAFAGMTSKKNGGQGRRFRS